MITPTKKAKLLSSLKDYKKKILDKNISELDESGTRLMINFFLTDVLGFQALDEVKTEYMIKGTYADYVVQLNGIRHFLVEVKAYSLELSEKHLRQTVNYGANEGIEWALLTNGRSFDFYKILFNKPIESRKVFSIDLTNVSNYKSAIEYLQYIHRDAIVKKSLKQLWNRCEALDPVNIASILFSKEITNAIKKLIKSKYNEKCDDEELRQSLNRLVLEKINPEQVKPYKSSKKEKTPKKEKVANLNSAVEHVIEQIVENTNPDSPILS
ncbi:MAG: type I restriction enzyme HsdR N-terminal domain-containing protein [Chitinophagaceae bacterium]|nr:type I restriction enzyme HsdR N-terminal domain-containing protein [Chitinophagaceae bacterium]MBP9103657.1 type I restriction enzyme HsdR N-terminal domain-containing protein [Chitinophagaceae bacterium]